MIENSLSQRLHDYITKNQGILSGTRQEEFVETSAKKLNEIRRATGRTERYIAEYEYAKRHSAPTVPITDAWVDDVEHYADKMYNFDKEEKADVFMLPKNFYTNEKTQKQYKQTLLKLNDLYQGRLQAKTKSMTELQKDLYFRDFESDRDFIRSYFEYEKYQERERNYDDGEAPTDELAPKKQPKQEEHIEYADTKNKSLRIPREKSVESAIARVTANNKNKQTKTKDKTLSGPKKDDDDWLPGSH